jgi:hypothetical protein
MSLKRNIDGVSDLLFFTPINDQPLINKQINYFRIYFQVQGDLEIKALNRSGDFLCRISAVSFFLHGEYFVELKIKFENSYLR